MDYSLDNSTVYYKLELLDENTGESMSVLRRYSAICNFRQQLFKEIETNCQCPSDENRCKPCLTSLKQCNFPAKSWFPKDGIQPELISQRAIELSYFLQDVVGVIREHAPLCGSNQSYLESSLAEILGVTKLNAFPSVPPRCLKGERSASCELPETFRPYQRDRAGSAPFTSKRLIL